MKLKKIYIVWTAILFYLVFLCFNTSYQELNSYNEELKNNYGYWEIKYLGKSSCNTRVIRIGDMRHGLTDSEAKEGTSCGLFNMSKIVLEGPFPWNNIEVTNIYYKMFCENTIKFLTLYCVSGG